MKKILGWTLVLVVTYLCALLVLMPTRFAFNQLAPKIGLQLDRSWTFQSASGRLLNGELQGLKYQDKMLGRVSWQLDFPQLLVGDVTLHWSIHTQNGSLNGDVTLEPSGVITLTDVQGDVPAAEMLHLFPYALVQVSGMISADIAAIQIEKNRMKAIDGRLLWRQAEIRYADTFPLGDVLVEFSTQREDGRIEANITNREGIFIVNSSAIPDSRGGYQLKGVLDPVDDRSANLIKMLSMLGTVDRAGNLRFNRTGKIY